MVQKKYLFIVILILISAVYVSASPEKEKSKKKEDYIKLNWKRVKIADIQNELKTGKDINAPYPPYGLRPLIDAAAECRNPEIIRFMIDSGADVNLPSGKNNNGFSTLETPLMKAASYNSPTIVKLLINNGADIEALSRTEKNALYRSISSKNFETFKTLLAMGANPNAKIKYGKTVLSAAVELSSFKNDKFINLLIKNGADVNALDSNGNTPLINAGSSAIIARLLLENGADVNARDSNGNTALILSRYASHAEVLLNYGADINAVNKKGENALFYFLGDNHKGKKTLDKSRMVQCLIENGINLQQSGNNIMTLLINQDLDLASYIAVIDATKDLEIKDENGMTPLLHAAKWDNTAYLESLITNGADLSATDNNGNNLEWHAKQNKNPEHVLALIRKISKTPFKITSSGEKGRWERPKYNTKKVKISKNGRDGTEGENAKNIEAWLDFKDSSSWPMEIQIDAVTGTRKISRKIVLEKGQKIILEALGGDGEDGTDGKTGTYGGKTVYDGDGGDGGYGGWGGKGGNGGDITVHLPESSDLPLPWLEIKNTGGKGGEAGLGGRGGMGDSKGRSAEPIELKASGYISITTTSRGPGQDGKQGGSGLKGRNGDDGKTVILRDIK